MLQVWTTQWALFVGHVFSESVGNRHMQGKRCLGIRGGDRSEFSHRFLKLWIVMSRLISWAFSGAPRMATWH